jgi:hypothetical protein
MDILEFLQSTLKALDEETTIQICAGCGDSVPCLSIGGFPPKCTGESEKCSWKRLRDVRQQPAPQPKKETEHMLLLDALNKAREIGGEVWYKGDSSWRKCVVAKGGIPVWDKGDDGDVDRTLWHDKHYFVLPLPVKTYSLAEAMAMAPDGKKMVHRHEDGRMLSFSGNSLLSTDVPGIERESFALSYMKDWRFEQVGETINA